MTANLCVPFENEASLIQSSRIELKRTLDGRSCESSPVWRTIALGRMRPYAESWNDCFRPIHSPPGAVAVRCDRDLGWKVRGAAVA